MFGAMSFRTGTPLNFILAVSAICRLWRLFRYRRWSISAEERSADVGGNLYRGGGVCRSDRLRHAAQKLKISASK